MKVILYIGIIALSLLAPVTRLDIADLEPVEVVSVSMEGEQVVIQTDTEAEGKGSSAQAALEDLRRNTAAVVYLDTAEYLLVSEDSRDAAKELAAWLKPSVQVAQGYSLPVKEAGKYLEVHGNLPKLEQWIGQ